MPRKKRIHKIIRNYNRRKQLARTLKGETKEATAIRQMYLV